MQEDKWQDFDLEVRSIMQDAEEKAPRGVWRAVSSRLGAAPAARPAWLWPSIATAALAACAFAAVLFFRPSTQGLEIDNSTYSNIIAEVVDDTPSNDSVADNHSISILPNESLVARDHMNGRVENTAGTTTETASQEVTSTVCQTEERAVKEPVKESVKEEESTSVAQQWAEIEREESLRKQLRRRQRTVYAQASVSGNDASVAAATHMSPGSGSVTGVQEISTSTYGIPFSVGAGFRYYFGSRFSLGTGVSYSLLTRTFEGTYTDAGGSVGGDITHTMHYVGIPLNVFYDIVSTPSGIFNVHVFGGFAGEYCVSNSYRINGTATSKTVKTKVDGLQFSAGLGLGADFKISDALSLYIDPSVRYYFPSSQPKNIHTEKPLMVNFDAGIRFNF